MDERAAVTAQIGRPARSDADVVTRCHLGLPVVTRVPPVLEDGTPFPTLYWLTCPLAVTRVGRIESRRGVTTAEAMLATDRAMRSRQELATVRYVQERTAMLAPDHTGPVPAGGVGGAAVGVKCLHAHYAHAAAGEDNPVGEWVAAMVEPLDCSVPCLVEVDGGVVSNPGWAEPRR